MKLYLGVLSLLLVFSVSCNNSTPPCPEDCPEPAPEPTPIPGTGTELLVRRDGTVFTSFDTGQPIKIELGMACCGAWDFPAGWPQTTPEFIDYIAPFMDSVQMRLGPYLDANEPETPFGSAYAEVNGKADLTQWNPGFWLGNRGTVEYARSKGVRVFIDISDGWAIKHAQGISFDVSHPWRAINNVQGKDHITGAGNTLDSVHLAWVDKVVQEFGRYDNVLWMDGVEISKTRGYKARWSIEMRDWTRKFEATYGYNVHVFGTNGNDEARRGDIDFIVVHGPASRTPIYDKPTITTEYNPRTPLTATQILANRCLAESLGSYYGLWRHSMAQQEVDKALRDWGICTEVAFCVPPGEPASNWGPARTRIFRKPTMQYAVEAAKAAVGDRCGKDPGSTLRLLSQWLNDNNFCASGGWGRAIPGTGDALAIKVDGADGEAGWYEEWHPVFYGNGCYLNKFKFSWRYK